MSAGDLVAHQGAEAVIRPALIPVELDQMRARTAEACQVLPWKVDAAGCEIAAYIAQDVRQLHADTQALRSGKRLHRIDAHDMGHGQSYRSRNAVAVAV